jgi:23S rRNA A1618 N6-methylase RlmF
VFERCADVQASGSHLQPLPERVSDAGVKNCRVLSAPSEPPNEKHLKLNKTQKGKKIKLSTQQQVNRCLNGDVESLPAVIRINVSKSEQKLWLTHCVAASYLEV